MNKKVLCLALATLLCGCGNQHSSNVSSSNDSAISFDKNGDMQNYIYQYLKRTAATQNYELVYSFNDVEYRDVYNENYVYFDLNKNGGVLIDSYDKELAQDKILYQFEVVDNKVNVLSALIDNEGSIFEDPYIFDYMCLIDDLRFGVTLDDIVVEGNYYYTDDKNLILVLATVLGYFDVAVYDLFDRIVFEVDNVGNLTFILQLYDTDGSMKLVDYDKGQFQNVGKAKNDILESFIKEYKLPETSITSSEIEALKNESISTHSEIRYVTEDENTIIATNEVDIGKDFFKTYTYDDVNKTESMAYYKNVNGYTHELGIDAFNKQADVAYDMKWDELAFPQLFIEEAAFRKVDENTYHYFGIYADALFYSLTYMTLDAVKTIDLTVENGKVVSMHTVMSSSLDSFENIIYHYEIDTVFETPRTVQEPVSFNGDNEENARIKSYFDKLKVGNKFRLTAYDFYEQGKQIITTVVDDIILVEEKDGGSTLASYGYVASNNDVISFDFDSSNNVSNAKRLTGKSLDEFLGFDAVSEVFTFNDNGRIVLKPNVINVANHVFGGYSKADLLEASLSMIVEDDVITTIVYSYATELINGQYINGIEHVKIDQYGTARVNTKLANNIRSIEI